MKIQFFSDVHLEFGNAEPTATDADVVVAAGDIGVGAEGARWPKQFDKPTIYVAGNHEFYGGEIGAVNTAIRREVAGSQVYFLENEWVEIDDVRFLGTTLWTDFSHENEKLMATLHEHMNDYSQIRFEDRPLLPEDLVSINRESRAWLQAQLNTPYPGQTVVVTHHAPLYASWRMPANSIFRAAYCNDLSRLIVDHPVDLWIHGHVHTRMDYRANTLRVVCNPRGYDSFQLVDGFEVTRSLELA